jgi:hypothetical protein
MRGAEQSAGLEMSPLEVSQGHESVIVYAVIGLWMKTPET